MDLMEHRELSAHSFDNPASNRHGHSSENRITIQSTTQDRRNPSTEQNFYLDEPPPYESIQANIEQPATAQIPSNKCSFCKRHRHTIHLICALILGIYFAVFTVLLTTL